MKRGDRVELVSLDNGYPISDSNLIGSEGVIIDEWHSGYAAYESGEIVILPPQFDLIVKWDSGKVNSCKESNLKLIGNKMTTLQDKIDDIQESLDVLKAQAEAEKLSSSGRVYTGGVTSYAVTGASRITALHYSTGEFIGTGRAFKTKEAAERFVRYEELEHELRLAMRESWGGEVVDWGLNSPRKYCVVFVSGLCELVYSYTTHHKAHFKTAEDRDKFFSPYTQEELKLLICGVGF